MNMRLSTVLIALFLLAALTGCTAMKPSDFANSKPKFVLEEYFAGKTRAWGLFEDRFGKVRRQFVVEIDGAWDGETLTLDEHFDWSDGAKSFRQWRIKKIADGRYEGRADDVIGVATGIAEGNALNWSYILDLETGENKTMKVKLDDWMFFQPGGVLLNRARMSKFGIELGQVTISFTKLGGSQSGVNPRQPSAETTSVAAQ